MNAMPPESIDAIVTDPPYGLGFMGKKWDGLPPSLEWAEACYRVLKPGGHIAAFGGTRTWHRLAVAIEDAGFEMRDSLAWLYGSGFPKSHDVSKGIDKLAGAERERVELVGGALNSGTANGWNGSSAHSATAPLAGTRQVNTPATPEAAQWDGWGTALKPAFEPIVLARKPLAEKTVARNVLAHGTGAINIDGCRIEGEPVRIENYASTGPQGMMSHGHGGGAGHAGEERTARISTSGRWPANVLLDHHAAAWVDEQSGDRPGFATQTDLTVNTEDDGEIYGKGLGVKAPGVRQGFNDSGGASRFFYSAKAPKSERPNVDGVQHPTVKPLAIMRWLIRLVTPPGGTVLDPFAGSGTTIEAAIIEGFDPVGIEMEADYLPLIQHRIDRQAAKLAV